MRLALHVSSGTYVRSIAEALGGHCTTLRRTAVGPFEVEEATAGRRMRRCCRSPTALARLPAEALERVPDGARTSVLALETSTVGARRERRARPAELERGRARSRSARSTACTSATGPSSRAARRRRAAPDGRHVPPAPAEVLGYGVELLATLERRLELLAGSGSRRRSSSSSRPSSPRSTPEEFARDVPARDRRARSSSPARGSASAGGATGDLELLRALGLEAREVPLVAGRLVDADPPARARRRGRAAAAPARPAARGRGDRRRAATSAAARSGSRRRTCASTVGCSCPASGSTRARSATTAPRSRSASTRTTAAPSGGSRRSCSTSRATSTAGGSWSSSGSGCATSASFESEAELVAQIARDVEQTRNAVRPGKLEPNDARRSGRARPVRRRPPHSGSSLSLATAPLRRGSAPAPARPTALTPPK